MANQFIIEIYSEKTPEDFTACLADPKSRMQPGSAAASTASYSASIAKCVAEKLVCDGVNDERINYLRGYTETVRKYMIHLIDMDVKCRDNLRKALKDGDEADIEAGVQASSETTNEIIKMMRTLIGFICEITTLCDLVDYSHIKEAAILAKAAALICQEENIALAHKSVDEKYGEDLIRENEVLMEQIEEYYSKVMALGY